MSTTFFELGERRAQKVHQLFGRIARRYDLVNDVQSFGFHRYWKRKVVQMAHAGPGVRALDVCCGTGDLALALARGGAQTVGLDFSQPMLDIAARKRINGPARPEPGREAGADVCFILGDAQRLMFAGDSFEIVTVGYGLRNLPNWEAGLNEMHRVAAPGGRLIVLEFGKPANGLWRAVYFAYLKCFVPLLGLVLCGSARAYAYILESLKQYPGQQGIASRMRELGLKNVQVIDLAGGAMSINYGEKPG
jgi:demethylmenaquinone methyltransferase/2-methoxy-6-polyprenyl-1,4-benzoquinol methylase